MHSVFLIYIWLKNIYLFIFKILFIHMRERERHRQGEKQAPCRQPDGGTRSQVSSIRPWAESGAKLLSHLGCPTQKYLIKLVTWIPKSQRWKENVAIGIFNLFMVLLLRLIFKTFCYYKSNSLQKKVKNFKYL